MDAIYRVRTSSRLGRFAPIEGGIAVVLFSSLTLEAHLPEPRMLASRFVLVSHAPTLTVEAFAVRVGLAAA